MVKTGFTVFVMDCDRLNKEGLCVLNFKHGLVIQFQSTIRVSKRLDLDHT